MIPFVAIFVLAYFLMLRPAMRQERQRKALLAAVKKNDKVITSGGIIGVVAQVKDDEIILKVDESSNVRLRVTKNSIVQVVSHEEGAKEQAGSTAVK
jgi:preprotein translocase subunit YajC